MASLTSLPPELIACILDFIPSIDLQQTTISLLRILSYAFVGNWRHFLFYHVHLKSPESVVKLFEHLRRVPSDATLVQKFSLATWTADAEVAVNLILALPNLKWLSLCMGASFFPEDMEKLFRATMPNLRYLFFRHRPLSLMESDRWYHFLDGSDFHSVLEILARWPTSDILAVSVMMDLPNPSRFEHLDWEQAEFLNLLDILDLPLFVYSPLLERTRALRMRYLWCNIAYTLYLNQPLIPSLPPLTFLDLSTCTISVADVRFLLRNLRWLRHLILDDCGILDNAPIEGWAGFGHDCWMIDSGSRLEDEMSASSNPIDESPSGIYSAPSSQHSSAAGVQL
ncbi:hypothetical protein BJV74DRAFT_489150 [Russula compacta]|nr:hypothetical protein BJV74DRAFT_489150 [Russula compacta]